MKKKPTRTTMRPKHKRRKLQAVSMADVERFLKEPEEEWEVSIRNTFSQLDHEARKRSIFYVQGIAAAENYWGCLYGPKGGLLSGGDYIGMIPDPSLAGIEGALRLTAEQAVDFFEGFSMALKELVKTRRLQRKNILDGTNDTTYIVFKALADWSHEIKRLKRENKIRTVTDLADYLIDGWVKWWPKTEKRSEKDSLSRLGWWPGPKTYLKQSQGRTLFITCLRQICHRHGLKFAGRGRPSGKMRHNRSI